MFYLISFILNNSLFTLNGSNLYKYYKKVVYLCNIILQNIEIPLTSHKLSPS